MSCGTAARALGRHRFALHEFLYLESTGKFGPKFYPIVLERISSCYRALKDLDLAEKYGDMAIEKGEISPDGQYTGYLFDNRARVAFDREDLPLAIQLYRRAYEAFDETAQSHERVLVLNSLSQCYFDMNRFKAARRACEAAERLSRANNQRRARALSLILLGEVDEIQNRPAQAIRRWKQAVIIAKELNDKELRFKAEFVLLRRALESGDEAVARAIKRRLRRLSPWLSSATQELDDFKKLTRTTDRIP